MSDAAIEQPAAAPPRFTAERRAELLRKADLIARPVGQVVIAGETATAEEARRAAVSFVLMEVTTQILVGRAEEAVWRGGERPAWAFPSTLTFPGFGSVGGIGEVLVDAATGEIVDEESSRARIKADARELALRTAP